MTKTYSTNSQYELIDFHNKVYRFTMSWYKLHAANTFDPQIKSHNYH